MIKAAIIGAGAIAGVHAEAFIRFPELCEVRAVCDIYVEKAQDIIEKHHLTQAKAYRTWRRPSRPRTLILSPSACRLSPRRQYRKSPGNGLPRAGGKAYGKLIGGVRPDDRCL